jgi:predicted Zn-dependent protease
MSVRSRLVALLAVALAACAVNPATGRREFMLVSESDELAMGREYDQQIVAEMGLYADTALAGYVRALGLRLAALSERPQLSWAFRLVDDPVVNAFAVPGGYIYITRGILAQMSSEAQLVSVLGHEIGHVTARHTAQQLTRQQVTQIGLGVTSIFSPTLATVGGAAAGILFLKFSRDDESEADELGFRYMHAASYDPREAAEMFRQLGRVSGASGGGRVPTWASTHPDPENRAEKALARAATLTETALTAAVVRRDEYIQRLDSLMYGANPREGYFVGARFLHPDLAFELTFPEGWRTVNQKSLVGAMSAEQDAAITLTLAQGAGAAQAARAFFAQAGVSGAPSSSSVNGLPAAGGEFTARTESDTVRGAALFVSYRGSVFRLMGFSSRAGWPGRRATVTRALGSFRELTDARALAVQPWRLDIVRVDRTQTPAEFALRNPGPVSAEALALLNQLDAGGRFMNRNLVKRVVGQPLP